MNKNKIRYCTLLLIDGYNHSKIFVSRKNKYYITNNKLISVRILNKFKDIRKPYYTSVEDVASIRKLYGISIIDITDNYYKNDKIRIKMRRCTILLTDDDNYSKIFNSEKNYTSHNGEYYGGDYYYYYYYDSDIDDNDVDIDEIDNSDDDELVYYDKPLKDFKRLVYDEKNVIVSLINNDNYRHNIKKIISK